MEIPIDSSTPPGDCWISGVDQVLELVGMVTLRDSLKALAQKALFV